MDKVSDESVRKHTQMDWKTWIAILDKKGGQFLSHKDLVSILKKEFKLSTWWQQVVAREYHVAIGIRIPQQTLKGTYTTTITKSIKATPQEIFKFITSPNGQKIWLKPMYEIKIKELQNFECEGQIFGEIRTITKNKRLRLTWINEDWPQKTVVQINLYPKPKHKCMIVIDHIDLPTMKTKSQMHTHWRTVIDSLAIAFEKMDPAN